jgi:DNA polymerase/3'-5' exonuclease PolX
MGSDIDMIDNGADLSSLPGIGNDLAAKIMEFLDTGTLQLLHEVENRTSPELADLLHLPGLGPKRVEALHEGLGITGLDELDAAARAGKIRELSGFGEQIEANILSALTQRKGQASRHKRIEDVERVVSHGKTRSTVVLRSGLRVDLRVVAQVSYGAALHYFTGSKAHNIAIRKLGQNKHLKINEYGVFRGNKRVAGRREQEVYDQVDLPYIEPELREDQGEIEAARNHKLPTLITATISSVICMRIPRRLTAATVWRRWRKPPRLKAINILPSLIIKRLTNLSGSNSSRSKCQDNCPPDMFRKETSSSPVWGSTSTSGPIHGKRPNNEAKYP